jgi:ATP-dependent helicase Lhr and Lhr-like helicase
VSDFDRLHPAIQHHIVNSLGWSSLRPLQEEAIAPVVSGRDALLIAPTAGGKTEAAVFPLLSRMLSESWSGLSVLYLCPLRALLNNLEPRLHRYAGFVGRRVALWHGDVGDTARKRILTDPPDVLLTTPESLEVMLISPRVEHEALFADLRAVVVDEVHAFAGDDRGWHLLAVLERIARLAGRPLQRLGLSATVGNPEAILAWLRGSARTPGEVVSGREEGPAPPVEVTVDFVGSTGNAATVISRLHRGEKRLVFCDSRAQVEELAGALRRLDVQTFVSHSSLSVDERRRAEEAFAQGENCVIVSTSTLELGIDVGDLDRVIQIDAPVRVSSFLQRLGRTGRRQGTVRNCLFLAIEDDALVRAIALRELWQAGYVEQVAPPPYPLHLLAQQILALSLQEHGIGAQDWQGWLGKMPGFATLAADHVSETLQYMLASHILWEDSGYWSVGQEGEKAFGRRHFLDLLSAFTTEPLFAVKHGEAELGRVHQASFAVRDDRPPVLLLAGRPWVVTHVDWDARVAYVQPTKEDGKSRWLGTGQPLGFELCQAIGRVLAGRCSQDGLSRRAGERLASVGTGFAWLEPGTTCVVSTPDGGVMWWTFAGLNANAALARGLREHRVMTGGVNNLAIACTSGVSRGDAIEAVRRLKAVSADTLRSPVSDKAIDGLKFSVCLPPVLARHELELRLTDAPAVQWVLERECRVVTLGETMA